MPLAWFTIALLGLEEAPHPIQDQPWFAPTLLLLTMLMAFISWEAISARRKLARQSAKSLDLSELRYRQIVESAQEGIATVDADGVCTQANQEFARLLGRPIDEILKRHYTDWVPPELHQMSHDLVKRKQQGLSDAYEVEVPTPDGVRYFAVQEKPMPSPDGRYAGYLLTVTDLTGRKRAEDAIRRSERDHRMLFEKSPNARLLVDRETFRIYRVNSAACEMFGYTREDFSRIGMLDLQTPEGVETSRRLFANPMVEGPVERQYMRNDATPIDVTVYAHDQEFEGHPCRQLLVIDQTEQLRAANRLRESEETLALAQEIAGIGSYQARLGALPGGATKRKWSAQLYRLMGVDPGVISSADLDLRTFIHPDDLPEIAEISGKLIGDGTPIRHEHRIIRADGAVRYMRTTARRMPGDGRDIIGTMQDITEQRAMHEQFEQSQRLDSIGRLAGGVAHDFNNLLTVINGYSKLALRKLAPQDRLYGDLELIADAGREAAELTRRLLAFGRKQVLKPATLDLNEVIGEAEILLTRLIGEDMRLSIQLSKSPALVRADLVQMNQVLLNLATNARDAMPRGGVITIETAQAALDNGSSQIRLSFSDTGDGMNNSTLSRIFEPFFTTKDRTGGTGLGLATVYGIVKQSGGSIHVESEIGKGTRFDILLPSIRQTGDAPAPAAAAVFPVAASGTDKLILLVEDQAEVRQYAARILRDCGYRVIEAPNGTEALAVFEAMRETVDLLLTDVVMPGMTGYELAEYIGRLHPTGSPPVLFMSGYDEARLDARGLPTGGALLDKPFSPEQLLARVSQILSHLFVPQ